MKYLHSLPLLALLVLLSNCTENRQENELSDALAAKMKEQPGAIVTGHIGVPEGERAIPKDASEYPIIYAQFSDAMATTDNWDTVSERITTLKKDILQNEPDIEPYFVNQMAAIHIVGKAAFDSMFVKEYSWTPGQLEILAREIEVLIMHENPQATLLAPGLQQLQGYWPDARIKEYASKAVTATEKWIKSETEQGMQDNNRALFNTLYNDAADDLKTLVNS